MSGRELTNPNRLHLAHNLLREIPYEFTNCLSLKYLNLRDNRFSDVPKAVRVLRIVGLHSEN